MVGKMKLHNVNSFPWVLFLTSGNQILDNELSRGLHLLKVIGQKSISLLKSFLLLTEGQAGH